MINYELESLFRQAADRQVKIECENIEITNEDLFDEDMTIDESLCSEKSLVFGSVEASQISFKVANVFQSLKNKDITVSIVMDGHTDNPFVIGHYTVEEDEVDSERIWRNVVAYDGVYKILTEDVAIWYNTILPNDDSQVTLKQFRDSFFEHFGIEQEEVALINDGMTVNKTIAIVATEENGTTEVIGEALSGGLVLRTICEINGCFGHMGRDGKFRYIYPTKNNHGLYPSTDLYPSDDLYPQSFQGTTVERSNYLTCHYQDYKVKGIKRLVIRQDTADIGVSVGSKGNTYIIQGNFLLFGKEQAELEQIGNNILSKIEGIIYRPFSSESVGNLCLEVGDAVRFCTDFEIVESIILKRTVKGIQTLIDQYSADGQEEYTENLNSSNYEIQQIKARCNRFERDIEHTRSEIANAEEGLKSEIEQTAGEIRQEVTKTTDDLSARIDLTVTNIDIEVRNKQTSAGIYVSVTTEDGQKTQPQLIGTINMQGLVSFTNLSTEGETVINGGNIMTDSIGASAIKTDELVVGDNIQMGENAEISWGKVNSKPNNLAYTEDIPTENEITQISNNAIRTATINCNQLNGGQITGQRIIGGWFQSPDYQLSEDMTQIIKGGYIDLSVGDIATAVFGVRNNVSNPDNPPYISASGGIRMPAGDFIPSPFDGGTTAFFYKYGETIYINASNDGTFVGPVGRMAIRVSHGIVPLSNKSLNLGGSDYRWSNIYSATALNVSSDRNAKKNERKLEEKYIQFFYKLIPKSFQYIDGTSGRTHVGFIAQDVETAMNESGISDLEFAGFCKDVMTHIEKDKKGLEINVPTLDEDGNVKYTYSLRYEEFIALNVAVIQRQQEQLDEQQQRISNMEETINRLCEKVGV